MNFDYFNEGDQLYQVEHYRFRFNAKNVAEIELLILFNNGVDDNYGYNVKIEDEAVPKDFHSFSSTSIDVKQKVGANYTGVFETKQGALQDAINVVSRIMDGYYIEQN